MSGRFLPGQVISYPYLWAWQHDRGETEGRKTGQPVWSSLSAAQKTV